MTFQKLRTHRTHRLALTLAAAAVALAACKGDKSTAPKTPTVASVQVSGVRIDAATFAATRQFELGLLTKDASGNPVLTTGVAVSGAITSITPAPTGAAPTLSVVSTNVQQPGSKPIAAAIDIDDSGSMDSNDPNELRAQASQLFWQAVLGEDARNEVAFFDFGAGSTTGFGDSRLLQTWTKDQTLLASKLSMVVASGGTPLYESLRESARWVDTTRAAANFSRVMLLMTDGQPNSTTNRAAAIAAAKNAGIIVHTVGLGPASDAVASPSASAVATVREIAEETGGVYAAATDAQALAAIFSTLATVSSKGQLVSAFQLSSALPSGTRVSGTVTVQGGGGTATANWSFLVP